MNMKWEEKWEEVRIAYVAWKTAEQKYHEARTSIERGLLSTEHIDSLIKDMEKCKLRFEDAYDNCNPTGV